MADTDFSTYITFRESDPVSPPFRIENDTPLKLHFAQQKKEKAPSTEKHHAGDFTGTSFSLFHSLIINNDYYY